MNSEAENRVRLFSLNALAIEAVLRKAANNTGYDFGRRRDSREVVDEKYFPQFSADIRLEAEAMAVHYRVFYCLENSIRTLVTDVMM